MCVRILASVQWPGADLYPPVPQSPLSPAAIPLCSTASPFLYPPSLYQIICLILLLPGMHLLSRSLSLSLSFFITNHFTFTHFYLAPTDLRSLCGGPESSGCRSSRMSERHTLTFRQPLGQKGKLQHEISHILSAR